VHVNQKSNLIPLCEECHDKEHRGELHIEGYVQTSAGVEVKVVKPKEKGTKLQATPTDAPCTADLLNTWKGVIAYSLSGWKQKSETTQKWKTVTEESICRKAKKILGREVTEDELSYLRSTLIY
jgi:hypothetical protein